MNVPNAISLARLVSVPFIAWLVAVESYGWALLAFAVAGASDAVDGFLARVLNQRTPLGAALDPAADKLLLVATFAALWWVGRLPGWLLWVVLARDVVLSGGYWTLRATGHRLPIQPTILGKLTTVLQLLLVIWILGAATAVAAGSRPAGVPRWALVLVAALTTVSGLHYIASAYRRIRGGAKRG